ncbi:hypothetical protein QCB44_04865 [Thiomicrorhabdus sp. zzn3]|uniref:hypothetical protein n=1 Tax=Thiomicrorhabdus sp. zzn3 TaxID=3039775 RepID=UPI0024365101|nr:hypothetical protein [Thiomicrorhabdus sp. zzn3]MDG6778037.1 hypothetical protein [Thiomicrorhabdus sp. zzn3]
MKKLIKLVILAVAAYLVWDYFHPPEAVRFEPGVEVFSPPQIYVTPYAEPFEFKQHQLTPVAEMEITGKVLAQEPYYFDRGAKISPVDIVLGWKALSDQEVVDQFEFRQSLRWYAWGPSAGHRLPMRRIEILGQSENLHLVPSTEALAERLKAIRNGEIIYLHGKLVNVKGEDGWVWKTSMSLMDSGDNSSEVFWIEEFDVIKTAPLLAEPA